MWNRFLMTVIYMNLRIILIIFSLLLFPASSSASHRYFFSKNNTVIGSMKTYTIKGDESLIEIARKFNIGYNEITEANHTLDPFIPGNGKTVQIPKQWILPDMDSYAGIVINLSEMRLYYFFPKGKSLNTSCYLCYRYRR